MAAAYLAPLMSTAEVATYADYTVQRGSIVTDKSFSASISVLYSETHQNTTKAESIREIYVEAGQEVEKGDKLMLLDNGETLKAGMDGVVTELNYDTTDWLRSNAQLIQICDLTNLQVSLSIDEYDVRNIAAGQKCVVTIVPLGVDFEAEITHVNRVSTSSGQVAYYTATASITVPSNVLPGMTASVTLPADTAKDVLVLDMAALAFDEEKQPYVLIKDGDAYIQTPVTTGLSDGMRVEICSGLSEGDTVWAVSGTKAIESEFSLSKLYKELVGEKIVINEAEGGNSRSNNRNPFPVDDQMNRQQGDFVRDETTDRMPGGAMPEGTIPEGFQPPQAQGTDTPPSADPSGATTPTPIPNLQNQERTDPE